MKILPLNRTKAWVRVTGGSPTSSQHPPSPGIPSHPSPPLPRTCASNVSIPDYPQVNITKQQVQCMNRSGHCFQPTQRVTARAVPSSVSRSTRISIRIWRNREGNRWFGSLTSSCSLKSPLLFLAIVRVKLTTTRCATGHSERCRRFVVRSARQSAARLKIDVGMVAHCRYC